MKCYVCAAEAEFFRVEDNLVYFFCAKCFLAYVKASQENTEEVFAAMPTIQA